MLEKESVRFDTNIPIEMRDGTKLYANIWRPNTNERYPAIIARQPYDKGIYGFTSGYMNFLRLALSGYAVVVQDVRGAGVSEGTFYLYRSEPEDGYDTVEWAAAQKWCNGNVGMYGMSTLGTIQWEAAIAQPPHLKAICPAFTGSSSPFCEGGMVQIGFLPYFLRMVQKILMRRNLPKEKIKPIMEKMAFLEDTMQEQLNFLPLKDAPANKFIEEQGMEPIYSDFINNIENEGYWNMLHCPLPFNKVNTPVFQITSWYDYLHRDMLADYADMKTKGGTELSRKNQKIIIGPWLHSHDLGNMIGELNFGVRAMAAMQAHQSTLGVNVDVTGMHIQWFDHWLKGINNDVDKEPPIRIFVMGANVWRDENEWPLARTKFTKYYLHSNGHANGLQGDGTLTTEQQSNEKPDIFEYDPRNPTIHKNGAWDRQMMEKRQDILIFTSQPLKYDMEITGPLVLEIYASSSAVDTDFAGMLVDVWPNEKAYNVNSIGGMIRARYRESISKPEFIEPGKIYRYSISLSSTSNVFKAGHRIRLEISSSNFPFWDRNLNTGKPVGQDAETKVALQTIYHTDKYPSHILLPVIPKQ